MGPSYKIPVPPPGSGEKFSGTGGAFAHRGGSGTIGDKSVPA